MLLNNSNLKSTSLENLEVGAIFSTFVSGGTLVRFLRTSWTSGTGTHYGIVSIGPYWDEQEPFWYSDSVLESRRVLDESNAIRFHIPLPTENITDRELSMGVAGGVYCTEEGAVLLGVRRQIGRTIGTFVNVKSGEATNFNCGDGIYLKRYQLVAENETAKYAVIFDRAN